MIFWKKKSLKILWLLKECQNKNKNQLVLVLCKRYNVKSVRNNVDQLVNNQNKIIDNSSSVYDKLLWWFFLFYIFPGHSHHITHSICYHHIYKLKRLENLVNRKYLFLFYEYLKRFTKNTECHRSSISPNGRH